MIYMKKSRKNSNDHPIHLLDNIEQIDVVLSKKERQKLEKMFENIANFNLISDFIEENVVKPGIGEKDFLDLYYIITKIFNFKSTEHSIKKTNMGFTRTFFELPELISEKIHKII